MSSCCEARSSAAPARSWAAPSRRSDESPVTSPAAFLLRPSSLSSNPISPPDRRGFRCNLSQRRHKKRQSRQTLRSIGSSAEEHMSVRRDESSGARAEKSARCELRLPREGFGTIARALAKKVRTPPPPKRPVQAPQRRDPKKTRPADDRRRLWGIIAVLCVVA